MSAYEPDRSRLPKDVCQHLCTKHMYMASQDGDLDQVETNPGIHTAPFWCGLTQVWFGPDGGQVGPDLCRGERSCCKSRFFARPEA